MKGIRSSGYMLASLFSLIASMFIVGCDDQFKPVYNVPTEYQPYVDEFINEAALRGYDIKIDNLIINYDATLEGPHCGKCNSRSQETDVQKIISINPNIKCWFNEDQQEALVFHEMGHCILGRLHDNGFLPNGDLRSVMNENDISVYAMCVYPIANSPCDLRFKRPYYLDELFNEKTPVPDWGN